MYSGVIYGPTRFSVSIITSGMIGRLNGSNHGAESNLIGLYQLPEYPSLPVSQINTPMGRNPIDNFGLDKLENQTST